MTRRRSTIRWGSGFPRFSMATTFSVFMAMLTAFAMPAAVAIHSGAMEIVAMASGALGRAAGAMGGFPDMFTVRTLKLTHVFHFEMTSFNF